MEELNYNAKYSRDGKWYWVDETRSKEYGPFNSEKECTEDLKKYCKATFNEDGSYKKEQNGTTHKLRNNSS